VQNIVCTSRRRGMTNVSNPPTPMLYINDLSCDYVQGARYDRLSSLFEQTVNIVNPGCPNPYGLWCGTEPTDPYCGTPMPNCQWGLACSPGQYCVQMGYQWYECQ
jgi:hypothetical protein